MTFLYFLCKLVFFLTLPSQDIWIISVIQRMQSKCSLMNTLALETEKKDKVKVYNPELETKTNDNSKS